MKLSTIKSMDEIVVVHGIYESSCNTKLTSFGTLHQKINLANKHSH